jgi:hypothetical protein
VQWAAFRKRLGQEHLPELFKDVLKEIKLLLEPLIKQQG